MRITKIYMAFMVAALSLGGSLSSCSDEGVDIESDEALPPGDHPLQFVASVEGRQSRSGSKEQWFDGDEIGVSLINRKGKKHNIIGRYMLNSEGTVKQAVARYSVDDSNTKTFIDTNPLEWPYVSGTVTAWFPFEPQVDIPISDQSTGIYKYDYLSAVAEGKKYSEVVDLEFKHKMAKLTCELIQGDGITDEEFKTLWMRFQGYTSATFIETELTGDNEGWITPDSVETDKGRKYEALLVPNEMTGKDIFKMELKVNYNNNIFDKSFTYPSPNIEAGKHYNYTITVRKDRIEVSFFTVDWNDKGAGQHEPTRFTFRVNLTDDLVNLINISRNGENVINTNLVRLSENVTPILNTDTQLYDKFDVLGNEFTISIRANKDTRSQNLVLVKNEAVNNPRVVNEPGKGPGNSDCYVENKVFMIADETTLGYKDDLNVGDYFFSDGSWSSVLGWSDVQCVGIVFAVNNGADPRVFKLTDTNGHEYVADKAADYTNNPIEKSNRIRGYVLALTDVTRDDTTFYKKGSTYNASMLSNDIKVSWAELDTTYKKNTKYDKGTLIRDLKVVVGGTETLYKKGTGYKEGTLTQDLHVVWTAMDTEYKIGTRYSGGTLISDVVVYEKFKAFPWSPLTGANAYIGAVCSFDTDLFDGYANMVSVKEKVGTQCGGSADVPPFDKLEALAEAEAYPVKAPEGTSGWYLPSIKQLETALDYFHQYDNNKSESPIMKAAGILPNEKYWSSTIGYLSGTTGPGFNAYTYDYNTSTKPLSTSQIVYNSKYHVRAVLTF